MCVAALLSRIFPYKFWERFAMEALQIKKNVIQQSGRNMHRIWAETRPGYGLKHAPKMG